MDILYAFNPKARQEDQIETREAINKIFNHHIHYVIVDDDKTYENNIKYLWEQGNPFIICEQDIVPTQKDIDDLANCQYDLCASKYRLYHKSTKLDGEVYAHRIVMEGLSGILYRARWINEEDQYCDLYGFGLTKITPYGKYPIPIEKWRDIDSRISKYTWKHGKKCHIHGEVKHNHR